MAVKKATKRKSSSWKMERATIRCKKTGKVIRRNKYSGGDSTSMPPARTRKKFWVPAYYVVDSDGKKRQVKGHFRKNHWYDKAA